MRSRKQKKLKKIKLFFKNPLTIILKVWYNKSADEGKGNDPPTARKGKKMYSVKYYDDGISEDVTVFEGTVTECLEYVSEAEADPDYDCFEDLFIVEPDGFTVYGEEE